MTKPAHHRWPLLTCLILIGIFDLIAATMIQSLEFGYLSTIMAVCYAQTLLSAIWFFCGIGPFLARLLVSGTALFAATMTLVFYFAHGTELQGETIISGNTLLRYDWYVFMLSTFGSGVLVHWVLCLVVFAIARLLGFSGSMGGTAPWMRSPSILTTTRRCVPCWRR